MKHNKSNNNKVKTYQQQPPLNNNNNINNINNNSTATKITFQKKGQHQRQYQKNFKKFELCVQNIGKKNIPGVHNSRIFIQSILAGIHRKTFAFKSYKRLEIDFFGLNPFIYILRSDF